MVMSPVCFQGSSQVRVPSSSNIFDVEQWEFPRESASNVTEDCVKNAGIGGCHEAGMFTMRTHLQPR